jgi:UDPglucose 6-dehydrogenase
MDEARRVFGAEPRITYAANPNDALEGCDALAIVTEWKEFRSPDFAYLRATLKENAVFDGRNLYDPRLVREAGVEYFPIGRR